jgi:hypothetical protein
MINFIDRSVDKLSLLVNEELHSVFNDDVIPNIKNMLLESYSELLEDVVDSDYDFIKPEFYKQFFEERLQERFLCNVALP